MIGSDERVARLSGRGLAVALLAAIAWIAWGLVRHPGFQPVQVLRTAAPVLALLVGGGFTRAVALVRARADAEREFDRGGKALFMGFVMVGGTLVGWLLVSQAIPATWTALAGVPGTQPGVVTERPAESSDADCGHRLVVQGAEANAASAPAGRGLEECVAEGVWTSATVNGRVTLEVIRSALGTELVGVESAH